jgi:diaminohydroxyphosphoribosylaminopyrimidine deaminase/5-amino-6-(5-phosphoribosylamino)uracil reductase
VIAAGIARVVIGAEDPNPRTDGRGISRLREAGIAVASVRDPAAEELIEPFAVAIRRVRPYLVLKMAASLDGYVAAKPGVQTWLTGEESRAFVHGLRAQNDAVMVGAGTVRVDDPQLTVRPFVARNVPYARVVVCETDAIPFASRVLSPPAEHADAYARTMLLAPAGARARFHECETIARVVYVGHDDATQLDLTAAMDALGATGVRSVLCEGGPTLAGRLLAAGLVDRIHWLFAPRLLRTDDAIPMLAGGSIDARLDAVVVERLGADVHVTARVVHDSP